MYKRLVLFFSFLFLIGLNSIFPSLAVASDLSSLPSWQNTAAKQNIISFVTRVTNGKSPDYIPAAQRIATFDIDGTLWAEQPLYTEFLFVLDHVKQLAPQHPEWATQAPFASVLKNDLPSVMAAGEEGLITLLMATRNNTNTEEFGRTVQQWLTTARHPTTRRPYSQMVYQPMLELMDYLKANAFKVYIVTSSTADFVRPIAENLYGIPPEQVIGSNLKTKWQLIDGVPSITYLPEIELNNDKEYKPLTINSAIGRRPVIAVGNSDGDWQMLQWTTAGTGSRLGILIHHTDAEHEWAYDRDSEVGRLNKALDEAPKRGWIVVDMKADWKRIFP